MIPTPEQMLIWLELDYSEAACRHRCVIPGHVARCWHGAVSWLIIVGLLLEQRRGERL